MKRFENTQKVRVPSPSSDEGQTPTRFDTLLSYASKELNGQDMRRIVGGARFRKRRAKK